MGLLSKLLPWRASEAQQSDDEETPERIEPPNPPKKSPKEIRHDETKLLESPGISVWKATREGIARLEIPKGEYIMSRKRGRSVGKCRASKAYVKELYTVSTKYGVKKTHATPNNIKTERSKRSHRSIHDATFKYEENSVVEPEDPFDTSPRVCASGIHFYMNEILALNHHLRSV
jgi:hypothetical protein